jgi:hypothetical protein
MLMLILISVSLLDYLPGAKAPSVGLTSGGLGTFTCPNGEQHEGAISISATTTPSVTGNYDIDIPTANGSMVKSGIFNYVDIHPSDGFKLAGKETRDDICGSLENISSIPITITGECVAGGVVSTIKFTWSNGQTGNFPGDPTCT